jgi:hypothetical protein
VATPDPEAAGFSQQDCTRGATAADALGVQYKVGASTTPGRDYSKIGNDGSVLPATAVLGAGASDWGCTRDNVTGLVWEVRTNDNGLRDKDHTYTWYDPAGLDAEFGNTRGVVGTNTCNGTLPGGQCNISAYRDAVNALSGANRLCGQTDWRLPTPKELQSIIDYGRANPALDEAWFPNLFNVTQATVGINYWTALPAGAYPNFAWLIGLTIGDLGVFDYGIALSVVLVRGGQ